MKKVFSAVLVCLLVFSLAGCNGNGAATSAPPSSTPESTLAPSETPPAETETPTSRYADAYAEYLAIFREYSADIAAYTWGMGDGQVAVEDILGDATPEFVFLLLRHPDATEAYLSVYTYENGSSECIYYHMKDVNAGSGTSYCLFTTVDGRVFLYTRSASADRIYSYTELALDDRGKLVMFGIFSHTSTPSEDYTTYSHSYWHDGVELEESEYRELEESVLGYLKDVVIWSCTEEDGAMLAKITEMGKSSAMTPEDAVVYLIDKAGVASHPSAEPNSNPNSSVSSESTEGFTEEKAIAFLIPRIITSWRDANLDEAKIAEICNFWSLESDRLVDGEPIFLIRYELEGIGEGFVLVFADGAIIESTEPQYENYKSYFTDPYA